MTLARLQQATTLGSLAAALAWAGWFGARGAWGWAAGGALLALFGYAAVLAFEYACVVFVNRGDSAPPASRGQLLRAWLGEVATAPRVFCWRQPFRSRRCPDRLDGSGRGVLLVHGFVCNRGFWNPWMERLAAAGIPHLAVNLEPVFGSIDAYTGTIDAAARRLEAVTGTPPLVVAHSMGGLAVRAWLAQANADARVHHVVTIGTPHHGTWLARYAWSTNGRQMQIASAWLRALEARETRRAPYTCFYSHCDNITLPASSATLAGADNRHVAGVAHVHLAFTEEVYAAALTALRAPPRPSTARTSPRG